ncbi:Nn.00g082380.m01.CDS01 [Neocucurbitaria sp. VM-36]
MDQVRIAELNPEQPALESKQFKATVTLIWPYSSSARQFALLLAEPDFRLRRKKGQVRARFSGTSAKAIATTGVGIGDEVILSLRGAQFVKEGAVNTPGKSIDWELSYTQTLVVQIYRNGSELANLDLVDAAPTPAPRSPVRYEPVAAPSSAHQWSSPAFLKRMRLSDGPFFEAPYDPLADENDESHDKKRRRKSYRDWKAWTYSARTPSPEKEHDSAEEDFGIVEASPSRPTNLPDTPVSPAKPNMLSDAAASPEYIANAENTNERVIGHDEPASSSTKDDFVRDADYYELYAGPDEFPLSDTQYAFGGDTEANTEEEEEEEDVVQDEPDAVSLSTTEVNTEEDDRSHGVEIDIVEKESSANGGPQANANHLNQDSSLINVAGARHATEILTDNGEDERSASHPETIEEPMPIHNAPTLVMPPPTLASLQTNFPSAAASGMLTPIGREPASPILQPLDSATLPLPSPFPGERDVNTTSYFDNIATGQHTAEPPTTEQEPPDDAGYILETSFFSSINSSKASWFHPNHESAFTPVRFTFGMDGAGFPRPMELSSPAPEVAPLDFKKDLQHDTGSSATDVQHDPVIPLDTHISVSLPQDTVDDKVYPKNIGATIEAPSDNTLVQAGKPEVIELSSGSESEESEESEAESNTQVPENDDIDEVGPTSTHQSVKLSAVFDLGSPSEAASDEESLIPGARPDLVDSVGDEGLDERLMFGIQSAPEPGQRPDNRNENLPPDVESHSELISMEFVPEFSNATLVLEEGMPTHNQSQQARETSVDYPEEEQSLAGEAYESQLVLDDSDAYMQDVFPLDEPQDVPEWELLSAEDHHPDIKMESIEEVSLFHMAQPNTQQVEDDHRQLAAESVEEILIAVPEEGDHLGDLHTISVPATAPAKNTRSKTKASVSPTKGETPASKRTTRSTRSKASMTPIARTNKSPAQTRTRSTVSPSQDTTRSSPYSLRSQSKLLSSPRDTSAAATATTRSKSYKHASHKSIDSISDIVSPRLGGHGSSFEPSQEPSTSQGRYSNVPFVKDSEEESLRSEQSLSTVQRSDNWGGLGVQYTNLSDPLQGPTGGDDITHLAPPSASAPESKTGPITRTTVKSTELQVANLTRGNRTAQSTTSSLTQPPAGSPGRRLRSAGPAEIAPPSPRDVRSTRRHVYDLSPEPQEEYMEERPDDATSKATLTGEGESEDDQIHSSPPPAPSDLVALPGKQSPSTATSLSIDQQTFMDSHMPITPEATQQTTMESQRRTAAMQQQGSLLMTPQLTQATSAGVRSFHDVADVEETATEPVKQISPIAKSTPRRNVTSTDVASTSASPHSEAASLASDVAEPDQPSIGLSTPLAYYTPLKDLIYFLNRSSQFHSSANPDILALVTSATTPSEKAKKGPKHWNTTLHITDLSTWPATTTVQLFRAYQTALPHADTGDIILLRSFAVKSLNRQPMLISADESSWCVWRYGKPVWGAKRGAYGEIKAREEMRGPTVERGEGEWREVERLRTWWVQKVKGELEEKEASHVKTRSKDKVAGKESAEVGAEETATQMKTRSKGKADEPVNGDA